MTPPMADVVERHLTEDSNWWQQAGDVLNLDLRAWTVRASARFVDRATEQTVEMTGAVAGRLHDLRARLSQAGAGGGVVVRPLEWQEEFRDGTFVKLIALTPFGAYEASSEFTALTNKGPMTALPRWKGQLDSSSHEAVSLDEAKATAQADYETRILAALAPSPSAGEIEHDPHDHSREYIPLPGGWEVQTKGAGSSYRLLDKKTGERHSILSGKDWQGLQAFFTRFAHELFEACRTPPATPVQPTASVEAGDLRPANCRFRLFDEGKPYPKSSCQACGKGIATGLGKQCSLTPATAQGTENDCSHCGGSGRVEIAPDDDDNCNVCDGTGSEPTPSSPVSAPSPAGGVREALEALRNDILRLNRRIEPIGGQRFSYVALENVEALFDAALSSPATPEPETASCVRYDEEPRVEALERDVPVVWRRVSDTLEYALDIDTRRIIGARIFLPPPDPVSAPATGEVVEAARHVHDKFKRDMEQGYRTRDKEFAVSILGRALSNPAPGHGEGGL